MQIVFTALSEFCFLGFYRDTIYKLITAITAFLIAFLIKINNKKLDPIIFHVSDNLTISRAVLFCFAHVGHF